MAIQVNPDQLMSFGGSTDPCAVCTFGNIGRIDNRQFSKQVMDKISKDLHISGSRFEFCRLCNLYVLLHNYVSITITDCNFIAQLLFKDTY